MTKIILAADTSNWAFAKVANHIAKNSGHQVEVIYTADFPDYNAMARYLSLAEFDVCHFFWRLYYHRFIEHLKSRQDFDQLMRKKFTVSVPDFALLTDDYRQANMDIARTAAGMVFTNNDLGGIYASRFPTAGVTRVINDPLLAQPDSNKVEAQIAAKKKRPFRIAWVGNGAWRGAGHYHDYKGLHTVLGPVLPALEASGIEVDIMDSARSRLQHPEVMGRLSESHVLCMTSMFEGTSLPVLEAMASGNAILTTNTGIYPELAGGASVIPRSSAAFLRAITALAADRNLWEAQARSNLAALAETAGRRNVSQWDDFFSTVAARDPVPAQVFFTSARARVTGSGMAPETAKGVLCISAAPDEAMRNVEAMLFQRALCLPPETGGDMAVALDSDAVIAAIEAEDPETAIVFSGGGAEQQQLFDQQKVFFAKRATTVLWHGSFMEWQDKAGYDAFRFWNNHLTLGNIKGIAFLEEDMFEMFSARRRRVALVKTWLPDGFNNNRMLQSKRGLLPGLPPRVALFGQGDAAGNMAVQVMAAGLACDGKLEVVMPDPDMFEHIRKPFNINAMKGGDKLSMAEQSRMMEIADIVLCVGPAQPAPMVPLMAAQLGIPCIVGPAANIYAGYPDLEAALVVARPDDMMQIRRKIEGLVADYPRIIAALDAFYQDRSQDISRQRRVYYDWCREVIAPPKA